MIEKSPVLRLCISCRQTFDRKKLLKITNDRRQGILFNNGIGRSAYICKSKKCYTDSKIKKKLQKALKISCNPEFFDTFEIEVSNYINVPIREYN